MRLQITDNESDYYASVLDDNGDVLIEHCLTDMPTFFFHGNNLYVVLGPEFDPSKDWKMYRLSEVE